MKKTRVQRKVKPNYLRLGLLLAVLAVVSYFAISYLFGGLTLKKTKAFGEAVSLNFYPQSVPTVLAGNTISVVARVKSTTEAPLAIRGYETRFVFDNAKLKLTGIDYIIGSPVAELGDDNNKLSNINSKGEIYLVSGVTSPTGAVLTGVRDTDLVRLTFYVLSSSQRASVSPKMEGSKFYFFDASGVIQEAPLFSQAVFYVNNGSTRIVTPTIEIFQPR